MISCALHRRLHRARKGSDHKIDLRDASTVPLNFTKSINLALSERGINGMRHAGCEGLLDAVFAETIPMHGRMIHGSKGSELYQESQAYDVHGKVSLPYHTLSSGTDMPSSSVQSIARASINVYLMSSTSCPMSSSFSTTSSPEPTSRRTRPGSRNDRSQGQIIPKTQHSKRMTATRPRKLKCHSTL